MRSASMGRKSIPNWRRVNSRTSTRSSNRSRRSCESGSCGSGEFGCLERIAEETSNLEPRTSNGPNVMALQIRGSAFQCSMFDVRCSMFDVQCCPSASRRVMGAWWPSRSSKPLSARSTGRGMFDSYPLRQFNLGFTIYDLRFEDAPERASAADPLVNRKSQIANPKKGGGGHVARTAP